jgi:hypothetical protein
MQELNMVEVEEVSGGEAGVPHSDYYYGSKESNWSKFKRAFYNFDH